MVAIPAERLAKFGQRFVHPAGLGMRHAGSMVAGGRLGNTLPCARRGADSSHASHREDESHHPTEEEPTRALLHRSALRPCSS